MEIFKQELSAILTTLKNKSLSKISLRSILTIPFIIQTLLVAGLVGYFSFQNGQQAVKEIALQLHDKINTHIEVHLKQFLDTPHQINYLNANAFYQGLPDVNSLEILEHYFWKQIQVFNSVNSISFGYKEGGLVNAGREGNNGSLYVISTDTFKKGTFNKYTTDSLGNRTSLLVSVPNFDSRIRPWYSKAVEKKSAVWSDIYIIFTGHDMAISASRPVYDEHQNLLGVTLNDIFLSRISDFLKNLQIGKTGHAFVMEKSGLQVASSFEEKPFIAGNGKEAKKRLYAHESSQPIMKYAAIFLTQQTDEYKKINNPVQYEFTIDNKLYYLQASPIHDPYGIEWINVIVIPESDFMADINANKRTTIFLIIIAVLLALVLGVFIARWISKPILRLNKSTQSLIKGEFKTIDIERVREIDQLGYSFNFMAKQLEQTILKLKTQIAKRKQNEEALKESEKKHREILEGLNDAAYRMSFPDGKYEYFSQSSKNVFGYSAEEWINNPRLIQKIIHPDFIGYFNEKWSDLLQGEIAEDYEYKIIDPKGNERWIFQSNTGIVDDQKKIIAIEGLCRDITDHKKAELALRKSEEQLRTIFEAATEVSLIITDTHELDPIVLEFSPGAENIFGYKKSEMIGNHVSVLHPPDDVAVFSETHKRMREGKKVFSKETTLVRKSGEKFPAIFSTYPLFDENGKMYAVLEVSIDISERIKFEKQLQQTQKMDAISTLAGGIAHDFNNMLGVITGNVSYTLSQLNQEEELFEVLSDVQDGVKQAQSLTQQLLTFSKGGEPVKKTADINQLLIESAQFVIRGAKTRCEFEFSENLSMAEVDPGQINQVISNLVINANQAMPHGGIIYIRTKNVELETENNLSLPSGKYIKIIIEDQGIGISEKHLSNIFDPFFTTKQKGNGLGLSTVYSIIQKHKGQITVHSEIEKGTVFHVYIPASLKKLQKNEAKLESTHQGHGKVLIMDDQEPILKMAGRMLNRMGYETAFATDGAQTIKMYLDAYQTGNPFDLVILDLTVPGGMGGEKTIPELLKINPEVKTIVSSGYSTNSIMSNYEDYGFCGVVPKPYTKVQLSEVLNKIFGKKD